MYKLININPSIHKLYVIPFEPNLLEGTESCSRGNRRSGPFQVGNTVVGSARREKASGRRVSRAEICILVGSVNRKGTEDLCKVCVRGHVSRCRESERAEHPPEPSNCVGVLLGLFLALRAAPALFLISLSATSHLSSHRNLAKR